MKWSSLVLQERLAGQRKEKRVSSRRPAFYCAKTILYELGITSLGRAIVIRSEKRRYEKYDLNRYALSISLILFLMYYQ
jgi:hypothetical protein